MMTPDKIVCIIYSSGGIGDVGRHAVRAALDQFTGNVRVLTQSPESLEKENWNCSCKPHTFTDTERQRLEVIAIDVTKDDLTPYMTNVGTVISALGNRQPWYGHYVGKAGTENLVKAMEAYNIYRVVAVTSVGCSEDWPPVEFHWTGKVLACMFRTVSKSGYNDLTGAEKALQQSKLDYLLVRPMGLSKERQPQGVYFIQKEKGKDKVGPDMSKMDCANFVVKEALHPTFHKRGVVIGSEWENFELNPPKKSHE